MQVIRQQAHNYGPTRINSISDQHTPEYAEWGEVEDPNQGVPTKLEPLNVTDAVVSGSVIVTMDKQVPVTLSNLSARKASTAERVLDSWLKQCVDPSLGTESNKEREDYHSLISLVVRDAYLLLKIDECLDVFREAIIWPLGSCGTKTEIPEFQTE